MRAWLLLPLLLLISMAAHAADPCPQLAQQTPSDVATRIAAVACREHLMWYRPFIDRNGSRERELDEAVIMVKPALDGARLLSTSGRSRIVFQGNGGNAGSNVTFTLCDGRGAGKAQTLVVSNTGNLRRGVPDAERIALACVF